MSTQERGGQLPHLQPVYVRLQDFLRAEAPKRWEDIIQVKSGNCAHVTFVSYWKLWVRRRESCERLARRSSTGHSVLTQKSNTSLVPERKPPNVPCYTDRAGSYSCSHSQAAAPAGHQPSKYRQAGQILLSSTKQMRAKLLAPNPAKPGMMMYME